MKPSLASSFFQQIQRLSNDIDQVAFLEKLITDGTSEEDYLEFKHGSESGKSFSNPVVKDFYGKALSAFSNAGGGVLIWGIHTKPDPLTRIDRAESPALVPDVPKLCTHLDSLQLTVTDPPILGVKNLPVIKSGSEGFVVSFVPESRHRPHAYRKNGEEELYYARVNAHSSPARQSTLRRLFFPEYHSRLEVFFRTDESKPPLGTGMWVHNKGPGTAEEVCVLFKAPRIPFMNPPDPWARVRTAWKNTVDSHEADFVRAFRPFHPGEMIHLWDYPTNVDIVKIPRPIAEPLTRFVIWVFARNEPPLEIEYALEYEHLGKGNQRGVARELEF